MGWLGFFSQFFCASTKGELDSCHREVDVLRVERDLLTVELEAERATVDGLRGEVDSLVAQLDSAEEDNARLYESLRVSIQIPELPDLSSKVKVYPFDMTYDMWKGVRPEMISDTEYYAWPEDVWLEVLGVVQPEAKRAIGRARPELSDCDNYTLTMCDLLSLAFMRSGLDRQGAFMKLLSTPHSYCGFMMPNYTIRVYEPMSGTVVGWLGETGPGLYGSDTYRTQQAFFLS